MVSMRTVNSGHVCCASCANSLHRTKLIMFSQENKVIPFSQISRNHLYPQIGGKQGRECAIKFLKGLQQNGLGTFYEGESEYGKNRLLY